MAFLLVVIFLLIVVFSILPDVLPGISKKLVDLTVEEPESEPELRKTLVKLQNELRGIHMVDEFAKYAKLERRVNKLKDELDSLRKSRTEVFLKFKLGINTVFHVLQLLCFLTIIYNYRQVPVLQMDADWFTPINKIISFPTGVPGAVSVTFWIVSCRCTVPRILQLFR